MSQAKWTIINGVKWEVTYPSHPNNNREGYTRIPSSLWSPSRDIENPIPSFTYQGKVYNEICELSLEEALWFIK
tara:strand:- start:100 stop:321 length:222 start_codon:yes stop_codon:yes gene_type:complete